VTNILPVTVNTLIHNVITRALLAVLLLLPTTILADNASEVEFDVSPKRCVTLRQGQPCFVRLKFQWSAQETRQVCLYNLKGSKLKCWESVNRGSISLSQSLSNNTEYVLANADGLELQRTEVAVSWVYRKKRSKRRWRLF